MCVSSPKQDKWVMAWGGSRAEQEEQSQPDGSPEGGELRHPGGSGSFGQGEREAGVAGRETAGLGGVGFPGVRGVW